MGKPSQNANDIGFLVAKVGVPTAITIIVLWFMAHEFNPFRDSINWKLDRIIRNQRSLMQKAGIALIMDPDEPWRKKSE